MKILKAEKWEGLLAHDLGKLSGELIKGADGSESVVFGNRSFVKKLLDGTEDGIKISTDGTFASVPRQLNMSQFVILHACRYNRDFPIAYALMSAKTTDAYEAVYQYVFTELAPELRRNIKVYCDFEKAEKKAMEIVNPLAKFILCQFHWEQV